jgi:hypothetical protein
VIGTLPALLVIGLTWVRHGEMPLPLVAIAVGWIVLAPPLYDHSWPAIAFLILTAFAAMTLWPLATEKLTCDPEEVCYEAIGQAMVEIFIAIGWFGGGAILAVIRSLMFLREGLVRGPVLFGLGFAGVGALLLSGHVVWAPDFGPLIVGLLYLGAGVTEFAAAIRLQRSKATDWMNLARVVAVAGLVLLLLLPCLAAFVQPPCPGTNPIRFCR